MTDKVSGWNAKTCIKITLGRVLRKDVYDRREKLENDCFLA
jgi:hypothetical protein